MSQCIVVAKSVAFADVGRQYGLDCDEISWLRIGHAVPRTWAALPSTRDHRRIERDFVFLGLVGLIDLLFVVELEKLLVRKGRLYAQAS